MQVLEVEQTALSSLGMATRLGEGKLRIQSRLWRAMVPARPFLSKTCYMSYTHTHTHTEREREREKICECFDKLHATGISKSHCEFKMVRNEFRSCKSV